MYKNTIFSTIYKIQNTGTDVWTTEIRYEVGFIGCRERGMIYYLSHKLLQSPTQEGDNYSY